VEGFLVFLAITVLGLAVFFGVGSTRRRAGGEPDAGGLAGLAEPVASLPPVLLPDDPRPEDLHRLRFAVGLRGYRMDQVDQVLDRLADVLGERDEALERLAEQARMRPVSREHGPHER
jgi:DivIVA domain-containing protein